MNDHCFPRAEISANFPFLALEGRLLSSGTERGSLSNGQHFLSPPLRSATRKSPAYKQKCLKMPPSQTDSKLGVTMICYRSLVEVLDELEPRFDFLSKEHSLDTKTTNHLLENQPRKDSNAAQ